MYSLPTEVQLDIFKFLNFNKLFSIKKTNRYFKNFIEEYEKELAKLKFFSLSILHVGPRTSHFLFGQPKPEELYKPKPELYDFELSEQLEKKWKDAIKKSIPMYITIINNDITGNVVLCSEKVSKYLQLPNYPKDIEEMKIARYCMEQIFKCVFDSATFNNFIFNPEMIEILFYENKTNIPLQIQTKNTYLYCAIKHNILKIFFNHLKSTKLEVYIKEFHYLQQDILFKILTDGGNTFTAVSYLNVLPGLYNLVKQHIETSKDCSKMVANIIFDLSERADNIDSFYKDTINYQLCNKYNPKVRFSVYNQCRSSLPFVIIAKEES